MSIDRTKYAGREPLCTCPEFDTGMGPMSQHEEDDPHCAFNLLTELDLVTAQRDELAEALIDLQDSIYAEIASNHDALPRWVSDALDKASAALANLDQEVEP